MSALIESLLEDRKIRPVSVGRNAFLIRIEDALHFADICGKRRLAIIGIEGFRVLSGNLVPDMALIADFSGITEEPWDQKVADCLAASKEFLGLIPKDENVLVDFTLAQGLT